MFILAIGEVHLPTKPIRNNTVKKRTYIIVAVLAIIIVAIIGYFKILGALSGMGNPTGGRGPDYPYFITTEPTIVKKIVVPKGTKLTYEEHFFREGQQDKIMSESKLTDIELPEGKTMDWGGVPITMISKFFNPEMRGFSISANFDKLSDSKKTTFSKLWENAGCIDALGVMVKNIDDWSFNIANITAVNDCGVNGLYYIDDDERKKKEQLPDELYKALKKMK